MINIIEVKNLVKRYKKSDFNAVDNISFAVKKGEFFAFLGPNGAGKTTTISILNTTLSLTRGTVFVAGYDINRQSAKVRQNIGVIFQNPSLDENLTAEENVRLHAVLYGLYPYRPTYKNMPRSYQKKVMQLARILDIEKDMFNPIKTFSGGMKRKLEIIRSLMHKPKVLFLDEPTSGLDPASRKNLWVYLNEVRQKENTTVFLTTHYLEEAEAADNVAIINQGKIVTFGTPDKIKKDLINEYLLIDSKNKQKLRKELKSLKLNFSEDKHFKLEMETLKPQNVIKSINTPLTLLKIHSPTLEEAYLEIIDNNSTNTEK